MWVLVNTGDEWPGGSGVFHFTWLSGPNSTGRFVALDTPVPLGPRKRDQFSAACNPMPSPATQMMVIPKRTFGMSYILATWPGCCNSSCWRTYVEFSDFHRRLRDPDWRPRLGRQHGRDEPAVDRRRRRSARRH